MCGSRIAICASPSAWLDRTDTLRIEAQLQRAVAAAAEGDFSCRIEQRSQENPFLKTLIDSLHRILEQSGQAFASSANTACDIAAGNPSMSCRASAIWRKSMIS